MSEDSSVLAKLATVNELETKCYLLELSLKNVSQALDELVEAAIGGYISKGDISKARAFLPPYCKHAYRDTKV